MDKPTSDKLDIVIPAFRAHSQTFVMVLDGISEEDAKKRIDGKTNHIIWMVGNFVNMRYSLGWVLGLKKKILSANYFSREKLWMKILIIQH
jgi:hypothetical protein